MEYPKFEPVRFPVMFQDWCDLTFLHWRYPVETVQRLVPAPLKVETFDGSAWVGLTPFLLRDLRPPFLPPLPWLSRFPETNCRTYVQAPDGSSGVWFFSLDASRAAAVIGARTGFGLPYMWSRMQVTKAGRQFSYESRRRWPHPSGMTKITVIEKDPIEGRDLDIFLTARFRLYSFVLGRLMYANVDHKPWPLRSAETVLVKQTLLQAAGLPEPVDGPLVHFSPGVRVRIGWPTRLTY